MTPETFTNQMVASAFVGQVPAPIWLTILSSISFLAALWLTGQMRRFALSRKMLDEVNERSSHKVPTPRGGGISIIVCSLCGTLAASIWFGFPASWAVGFIGGGALVGVVGWIDDNGHVPAIVRLLVHLSAAAWVTLWVGLPSLGWLGLPNNISPALALVGAVFAIAWLINLFNFMDGIDGLAASEAASVTLGAALIISNTIGDFGVVLPLVLTSAAALGFLWWNWPPARIFMGDASSGFLGLTIGAIILAGWQVDPAVGMAIAILPAIFVTDATLTLLRRIARRDRIHEAHRTHAYQHLAIKIGRHLPVTMYVVAINWLFLFPIAWMTAKGWIYPLAGLAVAYLPLFVGAFAFGAGRTGPLGSDSSAPS